MNAGDVIQARYELVEPLGQGGMAEVWRATDSTLNRSVAIKFLAPRLSSDPEFLVRFFSEAQAVARISHPSVVKILDFGEFEDSPYLVMECVAGGSLHDRVGEPHEPDWAFEIVAGAARGAGAAHDLGIVHRDIKPGNILIDEEGVPKLADFGIASSGRSESLTATGAAIGSPHYVSPEQASGGTTTPASDVYALGIVLYELLTGKRPFEGDNITAVAIAHVDQEPVPPSTHVPQLGPEFDALVLRCLAKDPDARFSDGTELASALEGFDTSDPVVVPLLEEGSKWWLSRRAVAAAIVLALLTAIPAIGALTSGDEPASAAEEKIEEERLSNVGGLKFKPSASPTGTSQAAGAQPLPSPSTKRERVQAAREREASGESGGAEPAPANEEEPDPTPEPTPAQSTPQPNGSPTP